MDFDIEKKALYEQIADKIECMILNSSLSIKEKFPSEQVLAVGYGVSRPVIREALRIVKERGLIETRQGASTIICSPDTKYLHNVFKRIVCLKNIDPFDVFNVRITLEKLSVRLAAENHDIQGLDSLKKLISVAEKSGDSDTEKVDIDIAFHTEIAKISANELLYVLIDSCSRLLIPMIKTTLKLPDVYAGGICFHKKIVSAIENGDAELAANTMEAHLIAFMRNFELSDNITIEQ